MKFMLHLTPVIPATPEERERLAPIAHRTDKTQEMLEEMVDLAQFAEEIPTTIEPFIEAGIAFVGTVDDIRRQLEAVREKLNPDWFMILSDQGFLPRDEMKEQLDILGTKIIPEFAQ